MSGVDTDRLRQLQEELLQLKAQVPGLHLKKSTAAQSPTAPFPILCRAEVVAPADAERYDVACFTVVCKLGSGVAAAAAPPPDAAQPALQAPQLAEEVQLEQAGRRAGCLLLLESHKHPEQLLALAVPGIHPSADGKLNLQAIWSAAHRRFVHLISLLPQLLEPYQSSDAGGGTVRRFAVLNDQVSVQFDAALPPKVVPAAKPKPAAPSSRRPQGPAGPAGPAGSSGSSGAMPGGATPASSQVVTQQAAVAALPALPRAVQQELEFLAKRYRLAPLPAAGELSAEAEAAAAAGAELAGLRLAAPAGGSTVRGASTAAEPAAPAAAIRFQLELRPTDPGWTAAQLPPQLPLRGWLVPAAYPTAGSLAVTVGELPPPPAAQQPQQQPQQQPPPQQQQYGVQPSGRQPWPPRRSPPQLLLPALQREVLDKLLAAEVAGAVGRPGALRVVVRHVENHAGQLWHQADDIAAEVARRRRQRQETGDGAGAAARAAQPAQVLSQQQQEAGSSSSSSSSSELDDDGACGGYSSSGGGSSSGDEGEDQAEGAAGGGGHSEAVLPLVLQLEGLQLVDCDALDLLRLNLQLSCSRCHSAGELSFATSAVALPSDAAGGGKQGRGGSAGTLAASAECSTCHANWHVEVAPKLVHERSNVLAHVRAEGCTPTDLLPSWLAGQCARCASSAAFRGAAVGRWNERACSACHTAMRFQFATALFVSRHSGAAGSGASTSQQQSRGRSRAAGRELGASAASGAAGNGLLQVGQPLPDRGTCRHYKHSYRWLRFPCCGRRFPCDLCHEEGTADGHSMKWATRMVCGYCSLEQPVAAQCKGCSKKLAATASAPSGRHSRFWEGGKGQRDPNKLHPNDPRRYRGRHKTQSAKHKRVGPKSAGKDGRGERQQQ